jgi:hypothetical protein
MTIFQDKFHILYMTTPFLNLKKTAFVLCILQLSACANIDEKENASNTPQEVNTSITNTVVDSAKSQTDLNLEEIDSLTYFTTKLDGMYNAIIVEYKDQEIFVKNFKKSQVLWRQFMESQLLARYPESEEYSGGSSFGMCYSIYKQQLIKERISSLNDWLVGFPEGEMCGGSVKVMGN